MRERRSSSTARIVAGGLLALAAAWAIACSEAGTGPEPGPPPPPPTPNRPPAAVGAIPGQEVAVGDSLHVAVSSYFADPDGDALTYDAGSSNPGVATAVAAIDLVTLAAVARGAATITVTATDPDGLEASQRFEVTVPNRGPQTIAPLPDLELSLGDEAAVDVSSHFTDPDGDALTYGAASSDPAVAAVAPVGSAVTVRALSRGRATITVTAVDPDGLEATLEFEVTVPNSGPEPSGTLPDLELSPGDEATVDASSHFTDPDGDALTYRAASSDPAVAAVDASGSEVTVRALSRGRATITVTAVDPDGLEATLEFEVTVPNSGPEPSGTLPDLELSPGDEATVDASSHFTDPDGDALTYRAASSDPAVAAVDASGSEVTVRALSRGTATITVTASDADGLEAALEFGVTVPNSPPGAADPIPDIELARGEERTLDVSSHFSDPDGDMLTYRAQSSDPAVAAVAASGSEVTVRALSRGTATITVTASDPDGLEVTLEFEVTVPNSGPGATDPIPDIELAGGEERTLDVSSHFSDPDGDMLTYRAASSNPAVAAADASGSHVTVLALTRGTATITVTASDPDGLQATLEFEVTVPGGGPVTVGRIPDLELAPGVSRSVDVSPYFSDPDGDPLTFAAGSSNPDVATATVSGDSVAVLALARGTATITVTASDPDGLQATLEFEVTVPGGGPVTAGRIPDLELAPGVSRSVDVSPYFSDPDGDPLTYAARSSNPDVATATASGDSVAVLALARGTATITVTASDPAGLEATLEFEVTVPGGGPVTVGRIPDLELAPGVRRSVDVSPYFSDPDGDPLTYAARSSNPDVATATASGDSVAVLGLARGTATITVTASDPAGLEATLEFEVTVPGGGPVTVGRIPDLELAPGVRRSVDVSPYFSDPDGDPLTFAAGSSNPDIATATVSGDSVAVLALARGTATITVTASDPDGLQATLEFELTVPGGGPVTVGRIPDLELAPGVRRSVDVSPYFSDPDGDPLTFAARSSNPDVATATVSGDSVAVLALARGTATITVTASDPDGLQATLEFEVTVPGGGPVTAGRIPDLELAPGVSRSVDVSPYFSDPDGDPLTFAAGSSNPDVATATVSGDSVAVLALARGTATITVTASDPDGLQATLEFELTVPGGGPVTAGRIPDLELAPGVSRSVDVSPYFSDPDGDPLTFAAGSSNPDIATATVSGDSVAVLALARGTATITVTASDPDGLQATLEFELTVPGGGPVTAGRIPDLELAPGVSRSVDASPYFSDPDGDPLTFAARSSNPDVATATVSGDSVAVLALTRGTATITVTASDPAGLQATLEFELTVPGGGPVTAGRIPDLELAPGVSRSVDVSPYFSDPDGDPLTYAARSSNPDVATATASGDSVAVLALARGTATITVTASDPAGLEATLEFEVTVPGGGPVTAGRIPDLELAPGVSRSVDVSPYFSDPDGDPLTFAAGSSNPDVATATVSGDSVAVLALARGTATITVTASDPDGLQATLGFEVTVPGGGPVTAGRIPDLELAPGVSRSVDVSPYFSDPDGDPLTFAAGSSNPDVATATVSGHSVAVLALARGTATITVTASDPDGLQATLGFEVTVLAVLNRPPGITATLPDLDLEEGEDHMLLLSRFFSDPDGDALTFSATSSDETRVKLDSSADTIWIKGASEGSARVTATATDVPGLSTAQAFDVTVRPFVAPVGFDIELEFTSSVSASARDVIREAASTWESILASTELSDVTFNRRVSCGGVTTTGAVGTVDDLLILFTAESIDGPRGSLGHAGPCTLRTNGGLPVVGRVVLDSEDMDLIPATTGLLDLAIHEMAHILGFGLLWDDFGLLADPSSVTPGADTHFTGAAAIAAFNAAGGASYTGAKVPVDNEEPGPDLHWRASIFPGEAMGPAQFLSRREPLSAITIESLADLGYTVAAALADPYSVSLPDIPPGRPVQAEAGQLIYLGDDILRVPIRVVDDEGRVLRVIPPR